MDILQLLSLAYNGEKSQRTEATAQLEKLLHSSEAPHYFILLLRAGLNSSLPSEQSLSALIYAKNCITQIFDENQLNAIPGMLDEVKTLLYNGALQIPTSTHQNIIHTCVANIISAFEWNYLPQLLPEITGENNKGNVSVEHALAKLRLLYVFIKRFKTPHLEAMPMKLEICSYLITSLPNYFSYGDLRVDHIVFKCMECVVETSLQVKNANDFPSESLDTWFQLMIQHPERYFTMACEAISKGSQKVYEEYVSCLKRIAMISFSILNDATRKKKPQNIAKRFLSNYAALFFNVWQKWLEYSTTSKVRNLHQKVDIFAIRYIKLCTLDKNLYQQYLHPQLMHVVESLLFPYLCYNEEDESAFTDDSDLSDFVQYMMEEGFEQSEVSQRQAASNAILALIKGKKEFHEDVLQKIIEALTIGLSREDNEETFPQTFGFLHLLSNLRKHLRKVPEIWEKQMSQVLVTFVAPRVLPTVLFIPLRCKALVVCQRYSKIPIHSEEHFASFIQLICQLVQDNDPRMRLGAIDAMCTLLEMKRARTYIRPVLVPLVEECISFLNKVQTTFVPTALLYLVEHFAPELTLVLGKIGSTLVQHFLATAFDMAQQEENMGNEDSSALYWRADMSACAILDALDTIVESSTQNINTFNSLLPDLLRLITKVFENPDNFEFMEKTLGILLSVINFSKPILPEYWNLLPLIFQSIESGVGVDFFPAIEEVLDSYISNGTVEYLSNPGLMEATYQACEKILFGSVSDSDNQIAVPQLIEAMLQQAKHCETVPGLFDVYLVRFVTFLLRALSDEVIRQSDVRLQIWIIAALMDAFYYNADATLQIIVSHNAFPHFFDALFHFFRGAINKQENTKKGKKSKRKNNKDENAQEVIESLSILTRKVTVLGLTSLLEQLTLNMNNNNNNNNGMDLNSFNTYLQPTLTLIEYCIFTNDTLLASRCRISERNLNKIRQGIEEDDVDDIDLDDDDVLGIDDDDDIIFNEGDNHHDDDDDDNNYNNNDGDDDDFENEIGLGGDEGDNYESPIDDVCEVSLFLSWLNKNINNFTPELQAVARRALTRPLEEFTAAEATARRYRRLVKELDTAMEEDFKARAAAAV